LENTFEKTLLGKVWQNNTFGKSVAKQYNTFGKSVAKQYNTFGKSVAKINITYV